MKSNMKKGLLAAVMACTLGMTAIGCGNDNSSANKIRSYDVDKYVTLGDYDGMELEVVGEYDVADADVISYINDMLSYYPNYEDTDKQTVANGDFANIDYEGKKDGVAFDGGTAQGYVLEIGSGTFIEGFEEGLIGVNVGDTVDLNLTFPENYQSKELAGADVVFTVTVNKIVKKVETTYEDLTDEYVASNLNFDSVEALYNDTKSYITASNEQNRIAAERDAALTKLIEISKVAVPDGLLEMKVDQYVQQFTAQNCSDGKTLADYLSANYDLTEEEFESTITKEMESNVTDQLVLEALAKAEGVTVDDNFSVYVSTAMKNGGYQTEEELYAAYDSDYEDGKTFLEQRYLLTNALTKLVEKCNITYTGEEEAE